PIRLRHGHTSARCAAEEPDSYEERFDDALHGLGFFTDCDCQRAESDRATSKTPDQRVQHGAVKAVEADRIDVVQLKCRVHIADGSRAELAVDQCVVTDSS